MNNKIRLETVKLIAKIIHPLLNTGLISVPEYNEIFSQLKHIASKGEELPLVLPKLVDQDEAAKMLGVGLSNFKKLEKEGAFEQYFKRKMVGSSVRYRNTDIVKYIYADDSNQPCSETD